MLNFSLVLTKEMTFKVRKMSLVVVVVKILSKFREEVGLKLKIKVVIKINIAKEM